MTATLQLITADDVLASAAYANVAAAGGGMTPEKRAFIELCCKAVSEDAERSTGRWFKVATYTEVVDPKPSSRLIRLRAYPLDLTVPIEVREDAWGQFAGATVFEQTELAPVAQGRGGQVALRTRAFCGGAGTVQVVYKGGLAEDTDGVPYDLKLACIEHVIYVVKRAPNLHLSSESQEGGATAYRSVPLLESTRRAFAQLKKVA